MQVYVSNLIRDEGTVVVFGGYSGDKYVYFAVDHRPAQDLVLALLTDDLSEDIVVDIEPWQVI